jgi:acetoin utilization deacetylase AcuC-like enzyme
MRVAFQSGYYLALPERHPFPMAKYPLLRELLEREQLIEPARIHAPEEAPLELLLRAHTPAYVESFVHGTLGPDTRKALGFEWSPQLLRRARLAVSGTLWACETALEEGLAGNLAGGTHHAFADRGAGYCSFNDVAIALKELLARRAIGRAWSISMCIRATARRRSSPMIRASSPSRCTASATIRCASSAQASMWASPTASAMRSIWSSCSATSAR